MRAGVRIMIAGCAVALFWAGFAYNASRPADYSSYHRTVVQAAESAHDATQTARLVAEQELAGRVTSLFAVTAYDDATRALAGAQKKFAGEGPPDEPSRQLRDQLAPLLAAAVNAVGDTSQATDDADRRAGVKRLDELAKRFDDFLTAHQ